MKQIAPVLMAGESHRWGCELGLQGGIGLDIRKYFPAPVLGTPVGEAQTGRQEAYFGSVRH